MIKRFTELQLFSLTDGRMSTKMEDIYEMLNHICDMELMTHHLPVAFNYLEKKSPAWFVREKANLNRMKDKYGDEFERLINIIKEQEISVDVPQLKDEFDTSDFAMYMLDNSLLKKIGTKA